MKAAEGFKRPDFARKDRLIMSIEAGPKEGKTTFGLTAPEPIALLNFDEGLEGMIHNFKDRDIWLKDIETGADILQRRAGQDAAKLAWEDFKKGYIYGINNAKSVVVDTFSEAYTLARLAHFGRLDQVRPHHYGAVYAELRQLIRMAFDIPHINLILLHKTKEEWSNDRKTGNRVMDGFNDVPFLTQVHARLREEDHEFYIEIMECRHNKAMEGEEYTGPMVNFEMIKGLLV